MKKSLIILSAIALIAASCSKAPKGWSVDGEIYPVGDDMKLSLEAFNNGRWYVVDSLDVNKGGFSYKAGSPAAYPEIMRLGHDGRYVYFPVDSVDRINIVINNDDEFDYKLKGTQQARTMRTLDSLINASVADRGVALTVADATLRQDLFVRAFEDPSVMPLYYLMNKSIGETPLYDLNDAANIRLFGALAQRFAMERPDDPRGKFTASLYTKARSAQNPSTQEWAVQEASLIDIVRTDSRGASHSLAETASKGDVVLLSFTAYGMETSPAYNVLLNTLFDKYNDKGLQIFQVAFDGDETLWKETARNLPWIAVWNSTTDGSTVLANYNVSALPTTFIIDRTGTIAARVNDPADLEKELSRYM